MQRDRDRLKGFAYFENFRELEAWSEHDVDPLQKANIPLQLRASRDGVDHGKSNVMLIHDYAGGYHDYESSQGGRVETELYSCDYLQYVETFVYFSHKLVAIPPPTWTDPLHRNGVKVLGTFIVEPGDLPVQRMLEAKDGIYWVANKLSQMAKCYRFDGWLINIEKAFPLLSWSSSRLEGFLKQLRAELGSQRKVVWYDALTTLNIVWYQNTINSLNLRFALAAGSILTNYAWTPELAQQAKSLAIKSGLPLSNLYFGLDVWAQNVQQGRRRRVTWPTQGGGGTGTGLGVRELGSLGLGSGVFGASWTFEHFSKPEHRKAVERAVWEGTVLPADLECDCAPQTPHATLTYEEHPIEKYAQQYPAGSTSRFQTNFGRAFSCEQDGLGNTVVSAHVGEQSILPTCYSAPLEECSKRRGKGSRAGALSAELNKGQPSGLTVLVIKDAATTVMGNESQIPTTTLDAILQLFQTDIVNNDGLTLSVLYRTCHIPCHTAVDIGLLGDSKDSSDGVSQFPDFPNPVIDSGKSVWWRLGVDKQPAPDEGEAYRLRQVVSPETLDSVRAICVRVRCAVVSMPLGRTRLLEISSIEIATASGVDSTTNVRVATGVCGEEVEDWILVESEVEAVRKAPS